MQNLFDLAGKVTGCGSLIPMSFIGMGMVAPLVELCHPQAALEAATQN
jgi:hypothetical protein